MFFLAKEKVGHIFAINIAVLWDFKEFRKMKRLVQTEDDLRKVSGRLQLPQDILKDGEIIFVRVLAGKQWNNQNRLFPLGMEPELRSQMLPVLLEYVECGQLNAILGEIGNNLTSAFILSGWETKENPANCQLPITIINNSIPLDASGVIGMR